MAITKTTEIIKIEVIGKWAVQVATDTIIKEDSVEISRTRHRHTLVPYLSNYKIKKVNNSYVADLDSNNKRQWTHTATDISGEDVSVRAIANAAWTDDIKTKYKEFVESQEI